MNWLTLAVLAFVWGSSFILMEKGLETFDSFEVGALRVFLAFLVLSPVALLHLKEIPRKAIGPLLVVGLCGNGIPAFLFTTAQTQIASSFAGMLNSLVPLFALLIGVLFLAKRAKIKAWLGVLLGLVGAIVLFISKGTEDLFANGFYGLLVVLATICYAVSVNVIHHYLADMRSIVITAVALLMVGPISGVYLLFTDIGTDITTKPEGWNSVMYIAFLGIFGTAAAVALFNWLIKRTSVLFATSVTYLIPIVAIFWGFLADEDIGYGQLQGLALILGGVYLTNTD
ncbi:MAG: DMT family transporter [Salibacteraceae bacterium]